jgi:hypothetical protein
MASANFVQETVDTRRQTTDQRRMPCTSIKRQRVIGDRETLVSGAAQCSLACKPGLNFMFCLQVDALCTCKIDIMVRSHNVFR